ncbi:MAG: hypothetical protein ACT4O6_10755 [Reyranella sp.]
MRSPLERTDWALLAAFLLAAVLGTWTNALLVNDAAIFLTAGWLGDSWNLYFSQNADRFVATMLTYGPAWAARRMFDLSSGAYMALAHLFYFAVPLVLWLMLRAVETQRLFSRLYLAIVLALIYFPTEQITGIGIWLIWLALVIDPARTARQVAIATVLLGALLGLTHPSIAMMSLLYLAVGIVLTIFGRPVPRRSLVAAAAMSALLIVAYFVTSRWLSATNPTVLAALAVNRYDYLDPRWMAATMVLFPLLPALWLLLIAPGLQSARLRWRIAPLAVLIIAAFGLWFAAASTGPLTWIYARHTAPHILALALALAVASPSIWLAHAQRPLMLYAAVAAVAAISYNADLFAFGRFVDRHMRPGMVDVDRLQPVPWPPRYTVPTAERILFKWAAEPDYVRDVVVPTYDWHRVTLAFYSFFRSDRQSILYHQLGRPGDWLPYECATVERVKPRDEQDSAFLTFLSRNYCVRRSPAG